MEKYGTTMDISEISGHIGIPRSSFYSKQSERKRGRKPSSFTIRNADGIDGIVSNASRMEVIEDPLSREFAAMDTRRSQNTFRISDT